MMRRRATGRRARWLRVGVAAWFALLTVAVNGTHTCGLCPADSASPHCHGSHLAEGVEAASAVASGATGHAAGGSAECLACRYLAACNAPTLAPAAAAFVETPAGAFLASWREPCLPASQHSPSSPRAPPVL